MTKTTTHDARAARTYASLAPAARAERSVAGASDGPATTPKRLARAYDGFLGMPVLVVLAVMWVAGAALLGSCALALWVAGSLLVRAISGS